MNTFLIVLIWVCLFSLPILLILWMFLLFGGRQYIGEKLARLLPDEPLQKGDKAHIFLNGKFNRTATLSNVVADGVYIYDDKIRLPLSIRGSFYGIGTDSMDRSKVVYLKHKNRFRLIRVAELLRRLFNVGEDENNLNPDYEAMENIETQEQEEGESDEM